MAKHLWVSKTNSVEIVRGPSLPPGVEDKMKGDLYFHVHFVEWEQTIKPPSTCSLVFHWWGHPIEQFTVLAIPSAGYRPPDVTAIFPLKSGEKHLRRYFHDMGSLELVVIRDRKTWNGFEEAGTRIATSNLLLQDLTEKHAVNASCFLYDESQRFVGTLFVQVQVHCKSRYTVQSAKRPAGCRKFTKESQFRTGAEESFFADSDSEIDAESNSCDMEPCEAFTRGLHEEVQDFATNRQHSMTNKHYPQAESLENDDHDRLTDQMLIGDWTGQQVEANLLYRDSETALGMRSASFSDFKALGEEAALETAYLQRIDQETADMVSRIARKKYHHSGGSLAPVSRLWSNVNGEETQRPRTSGKLNTSSNKEEAETSISQESPLHRTKKAKQNDQPPQSSSEDMNTVLNRWFGNDAAPSAEALTFAIQDNRNLLDEKLDQLISDMKKGGSWTSTPGTPTRAHGGTITQKGDDRVTNIEEKFVTECSAELRHLEAARKCNSTAGKHVVQKRRRNHSPQRAHKKNSGVQVNLGIDEEKEAPYFPKMPKIAGEGLSFALNSGGVCASPRGQSSKEVGGTWKTDCIGAEGNRYTNSSTKERKSHFGRIPAKQEGIRHGREREPARSNDTAGETPLAVKNMSEGPKERESQVGSLSKIIGRAAALRDALAHGALKSGGPNSKRVNALAVASTRPKHKKPSSVPGSRPCSGYRDERKEPEITGTNHRGLLAALLRKLHDERPPFKDEKTDRAYVNRILRFSNTVVPIDGQEDPQEVAEEALLKELFFPEQQESPDQKTFNVTQKINSKDSEALAIERSGHNKHSSQGPLCLAISVENLILLDAYARDLTSCKCLLTLCFPAVKLLVADLRTSPEQVVSITPIARRQRELVFEHQSQFHWQLPSGESGMDTWRPQLVRVNVSFKWPSSDVVRCEGSIPLGRVVQSMPFPYFTDLHLTKVKEFTKAPWVGNSCLPRTTQKSEARATLNWLKVLGDKNGPVNKKPSKKTTTSPLTISPDESIPKLYATVKIGLRLFTDSVEQPARVMKGLPQQPREVLNEKAAQSAEQIEELDPWFYVSVDYFYDFKSVKEGESLDLVIKQSTHTVSRTPFCPPVYKQDPLKRGYTARQNADAVIRSSASIKTPIIFVEIWKTNEVLQKDGLEHFVGMIRVPLLGSKNSETVAAAEVYPVYNPVKDCACGDANVVVMRGLKSEMLKLQKENHVTPKLLSGNLEAAQAAGSGTSTTAGQYVDSLQHCGMTRHVFEVKVQELLGLPVAKILSFSRCSATGGGFMKYLFPGEKEALFTQEVKWSQHMSFQAIVRHVISLPSGEDLREHLESGGSNNLRLELWSYCSKVWTYEPEVLHALKNLNIDMKSNDVTKKVSVADLDSKDEEHMGTAVLPLQKLFDLLRDWRRAGSTKVVKKAFRIPLTLVEELQDKSSEAPTVTVQLAYERSQAPQPENALADTIFADKGLLSVVDGHPLEVSLEINIIRATSLQSAINAVLLVNTSLSKAFLDGVNSYVQFSLFPCNANLKETYPATSTPLKEKKLVPNYGWTKYMSLLLDSEVLKELRTSDMAFELWHASTHSARKNVWLGTASAPCLQLLRNGEGVSGWLNLLSRKGEIVGALQVAVCFTGWR